ncbi:MAG: coiled-coil domain-containing protein [Pseudobdellovibrio sp.]
MFDTLKYAKKLEAAGFQREQAEQQIKVITEMIVDGVATKQDLKSLEVCLSSDLKVSEAALRSDMKKLETALRSDIKELETNLRSDMKQLDTAIRSDMKELESRLTLKLGAIIGAFMSIGVAVIGFIIR